MSDHPYPPEARHDWRAIVGYKLTNAQAYKLANQSTKPDAPPPIYPGEEGLVDPAMTVLTVEMVDPAMSQLVCIDCEVRFADAAGFPCPGDPVEHDRKTGEPVYEVRHETGQVRRVVWDRWVEMHTTEGAS